jgi:hypothetical protein
MFQFFLLSMILDLRSLRLEFSFSHSFLSWIQSSHHPADVCRRRLAIALELFACSFGTMTICACIGRKTGMIAGNRFGAIVAAQVAHQTRVAIRCRVWHCARRRTWRAGTKIMATETGIIRPPRVSGGHCKIGFAFVAI